ncbi:MAG: Bax inhibitor-1/YccA family protein [Candidatus Theseobacter exili]|nr:Bax inhibitor-1/YccA family protein [Candidatus Theseobacter exili]
MKTSNPALSARTFANVGPIDSDQVMTIQGTVNKTALMLLFVFLSSAWTWNIYIKSGNLAQIIPMMLVGAIGGFIIALVTIFKKQWAGFTAPVYAVLEGLFLGGISAIFNAKYPGIIIQAVGLTFGTLFCLLAAYKSGVIRVTARFKLGVVAATGGIAVFYLISIILSLFGVRIPIIFGNGIFGILFSVFVVIIAALNLVLDFDLIEQGAERGAPKFMEWYGAFALMVTLIWLYLEILRLLTKLQSRR